MSDKTAVDILVEEIEKADHLSLFNSGTVLLQELMNKATELFQPYPTADQAHVLALMFGILIGEVDGNAVEMEKQGVMITLEERIRIFVATARTIAKATIADKVMGEMPTQGSQPS